MAKESYDHESIEKMERAHWKELALNETDLHDTNKDPYYLLIEFPYPSGDLHIGHWYAFGVTDIYARFMRMQGRNVLFPFGFDAFGLPAENAAIKNHLDPKDWTHQNMAHMREQVEQMGASFDWSKEVVTCDPGYYKWTQWLFTKFYEQGLAERRLAAVKWCPKDQTVLANEQVIDGRCERCGTEVVEKNLTQWFLKITKYAKRLLTDLEPLPWPREIKEAQKAWIGESEGAKIYFDLQAATNDAGGVIEVFTTRPDTIYGATYVVIAPEHPLVETLLPLTLNRAEIEAYRTVTARKTERERSENKDKTGVKLEGIVAINPATNQEIPVFVADYVLASYGTGAVMAVPSHDERDFEFATKFDLPLMQVVMPQFVDERNPPQAGKEDTERNVVIAILHDPNSDEYLCLRWKKQEWTTFITGGIEDGESAEEAALREIREETGYQDLKIVRKLGGESESQFYAAHKGVNRKVRSQAVLVELVSDKREAVAEEELEQYDVSWLSKDEVVSAKLQHAELDVIWHRLLTGMDAYTGSGILINSGTFSGRDNESVKAEIAESVGGELVTQYRLRDWLISRQRYWGCPIPVVYDPEGNPHLVPAEHLPWLLPEDVDFTPTGKSPLASSKELHERVERIFGAGWTPEYDTLDTFVDSSWYFLRYLDPKDDHDFSDQGLMKRWLPVNRYAGGAEHTTMHLLYSRFFYKALHDLDLVPTAEPFYERFNRGLIMGPDGQKMSKSKGNVVNPDEFVKKYGADAVRVYLAFIGPYNEPGQYPWNLDGVEAMRRFLDRVAKLSALVDDSQPNDDLTRALAKAIRKVAVDSERFKFNTAISAVMVVLKDFEKLETTPRASYIELLKLLAPFAPHLADYLFKSVNGVELTGAPSIHALPWTMVADIGSDETVTVIVQVNGKRRASLEISPDAEESAVIAEARSLPTVVAFIGSGEVRTVYVPGRIVNFVV
ncbi:MAG: class I tRNA ligase family protein [Candidatus Pacebacteria bacterium]|nr:class I tRNA ligase family protein [Candidatus Paceibacterota bacterium]